MIIINNDDFGYSREYNKAAYSAFQKNLISSTTTLVNFEDGLEDAITYIERNLIDKNAIGIHLNLTEGVPLTKEMRNNSRFCKNGVYESQNKGPTFYLNRENRKCVYGEIEAQMDLFISKFGFLPSHIDSHHHSHAEWGFTPSVVRLAKKYAIKSIRLAQNTGHTAMHKKVYRNLVNWYLSQKGFKVTDRFGGIDDLYISGLDPNKNYEIMVHARLSGKETLVDIDLENLELKLTKLFNSKPWKINNYTSL